MALAILLILLSASVYSDVKGRRIPNKLILLGLIPGMVLHVSSRGISGLGEAFTGMCVGLGVFFGPYLLGWIGAGDVKLMATVGALTDAGFTFRAATYGALWGGLVSAAAILGMFLGAVSGSRGHPRSPSRGFFSSLRFLKARPVSIPYAVAIALGVLSALIM